MALACVLLPLRDELALVLTSRSGRLDYFIKTVKTGPRIDPSSVQRVVLAYGPNGKSRGSATVTFRNIDLATKALEQNETKVDGKPMKVELLLAAHQIVAGTSNGNAKSLNDRITKPKDAPKPAVKTAAAPAKKGTGKAKTGKAAKPKQKKKTAEELDAEMTDYFDASGTGGAVQPAGGDANMDTVQ
ncbi:hypothetical protein K402DRAFT_273732 [Aulographum hederae CBS 113979]|uniref:Chromatin target of PRMT1 protein C-terminal domain-containing protein n=1 Tax=Aulographum hederae CBS 113979 TaxID=1176131 RepID=A0A6G1H8W4_9PEZI|nr:hypothetical protein K402DRAFT_273732 [Aulographum hederae CBS 113979]